MTPQAIVKMAEQLDDGLIWNQAEHDPLIQPIGRSIAARVYYAPKSDVYFVAAVSGTYDIAHLPKFADLGIDVDNLAVSAPMTGDYRPGAYPLNNPGEYCFPSLAHSTPRQCEYA